MSVYFKGKEQSLEDILKAREVRVQYQQYLLESFEKNIISYKLNIPGPLKYNSLIKKIFDEGLLALNKKLYESGIEAVFKRTIYKESGPEYFGVFSESAELVKRLTITIEETHPLGRLYDFDVLDTTGKQVERQNMGISSRKCLLCEKNAFECGRSRNHKISDLTAKIESMALDYFKIN